MSGSATASKLPGAVCLDNPADSSEVLLLFMLRNGTNAERMLFITWLLRIRASVVRLEC